MIKRLDGLVHSFPCDHINQSENELMIGIIKKVWKESLAIVESLLKQC